SGGETRVIRATYGPDRIYVEMVVRSLQLWRDNETRWKRKLFRRTGVIWMAAEDDRYEKAALPPLREGRLPVEGLDAAQAGTRFPQIDFPGGKWVIHEKEAGYLRARHACAIVKEGFLQEGGNYRQVSVKPGLIRHSAMSPLRLSDDSQFAADQYVF